jgi:molecular chaperone DnaJ
MENKDYYKILEVKKTDSDETIKKSYKKLALKFHPDKASDDKKKEYEEKFKEINEAYSTLSNPEKRKRYDMGETSQFNQGSKSYGTNFSDIFEDLLRGSGFGNNFQEEQEDLDLYFKLTIEFTEAVFGVEKEISIKKDILCKACDGTGSEDDKFEKCQKCDGHGRLNVNQRTPWGTITRTIKCNECKGEGKIIKNKCRKCNGSGIINSKENVTIKIPKGIDDGQTLRIRHTGNTTKNNRMGDLFLEIQVKPHKIFKRDGFDIYMDFPITFSTAALGGEIKIPTLSKEVKVKLAKGTESGSVLRLKGHGIPFVNDPHHMGDQFVNIIIKTPKKLSKAQIKLFKELAELDE